jgi:hypothetical protein
MENVWDIWVALGNLVFVCGDNTTNTTNITQCKATLIGVA